MCDCRDNDAAQIQLSAKPLKVAAEDAPELAKMKRKINSMKHELKDYLAAGGTQQDYMLLCDERLAIERGKVAIYNNDFEKLRKDNPQDIEAQWEAKNAELRDMGLPTIFSFVLDLLVEEIVYYLRYVHARYNTRKAR